LTLAPLARTLEPLHADRAGFREAGRWLASHVRPDEGVFDPYGWAGYYAGRCFREDYDETYLRSNIRYVVVEASENQHSHLKPVGVAQELAKLTPVAFSVPVLRGGKPAAVEAHCVPPGPVSPPDGSSLPPP
jgi:hypothetical protein